MTLDSKIQTDLKTAMLAKDEAGLRALRAIKSALLLAKTSGAGGDLKLEDETKLLQKLLKQRKESIEIYENQGREDLAKTEKEEANVIEKYLPALMSENEVRSEVKKIIETIGASSISELGKVIGIASKQLSGKANNKMIATIVKELLSS